MIFLNDIIDELLNIKICSFCNKSMFFKKKWVPIPEEYRRILLFLNEENYLKHSRCDDCNNFLESVIEEKRNARCMVDDKN